jgi:N-methylhydantoinase A
MSFTALEPSPVNAATSETEQVTWPGTGLADTSVFRADDLGPGATVSGPALVESGKSTCAVPPGWALEIDMYGAKRLRNDQGGQQ